MSAVGKVFAKEIREMMRDRRVRTGAFFMPVALVFLMILMFGTIAQSVGKSKPLVVYALGADRPPLRDLADPSVRVTSVPSEQEGVRLVREGKARLLAIVDPPRRFGSFEQQNLRLRFDPKEESSQIARARFQQALGASMRRRLDAQLRAQGLPRQMAEPIRIREDPVQVGAGRGAGGLLVALLPYLIVLFAFTGGFSIASDIVAGEKEKSTLETLLIAPVRRTEIVLGKFFALALVCLLSSLSAVLGLVLASAAKMPGATTVLGDGFGITPAAGLLIVVLMLPLVAFFASVLLAVSTFARNMREAQTYLGVVNLIVVVPAVFSQVIGYTEYGRRFWVNLVPVLNTATNVRAALLGKPEAGAILVTIGIGALLAAIGLAVAVRLFHREQVLLRV